MEALNQEEIAKKVESLFEAGGENDQMWKIISKFAMQLDIIQIMSLTKLTYIANLCSESVSKRLLSFRDYYISLHNNKNTALFMLKMQQAAALQDYVKEIKGQVLVNK